MINLTLTRNYDFSKSYLCFFAGETGWQAYRLAGRSTDKQTLIETDRQAGRQTAKHRETYKTEGLQVDTEKGWQVGRQAVTQKDKHTERQADRWAGR
jgi:hypothetical protein